MTNRLRTATLVVILFAPLLAYLQRLRYQFVFDDPDQIGKQCGGAFSVVYSSLLHQSNVSRTQSSVESR